MGVELRVLRKLRVHPRAHGASAEALKDRVLAVLLRGFEERDPRTFVFLEVVFVDGAFLRLRRGRCRWLSRVDCEDELPLLVLVVWQLLPFHQGLRVGISAVITFIIQFLSRYQPSRELDIAWRRWRQHLSATWVHGFSFCHGQ